MVIYALYAIYVIYVICAIYIYICLYMWVKNHYLFTLHVVGHTFEHC